MSDYWRDDESGMEEIDFCLPFSAPSDIALIPYHARGPLASDITTPALSILEHPQVPEYFDVPDYCCTDPSPPSIAHVRQLDQFEHVQQQPDYRFSILGNAYSHIWPDGAPDTLDSQRDAENSIMQTPIGNFECNALPDHTTFLTSMGQYPASVLALCPQQITMEEQRSSLLGEGALTASQINAVTDAIGSVRTEDDAAHSILSLAQSELNASPKASVSNASNINEVLMRRPFVCAECRLPFDRVYLLEGHGTESGHNLYECDHEGCEKGFTRSEDLKRHKLQHRDDVQRFPCSYCRKHRGPTAFKRKDHLKQHERQYHHIGEPKNPFVPLTCPHKDCTEYRKGRTWILSREERPFLRSSDYTQHMRNVHDEMPFPCEKVGCDRVGGKGFARKRNLLRHQKAKHNEKTIEEISDLMGHLQDSTFEI